MLSTFISIASSVSHPELIRDKRGQQSKKVSFSSYNRQQQDNRIGTSICTKQHIITTPGTLLCQHREQQEQRKFCSQ